MNETRAEPRRGGARARRSGRRSGLLSSATRGETTHARRVRRQSRRVAKPSFAVKNPSFAVKNPPFAAKGARGGPSRSSISRRARLRLLSFIFSHRSLLSVTPISSLGGVRATPTRPARACVGAGASARRFGRPTLMRMICASTSDVENSHVQSRAPGEPKWLPPNPAREAAHFFTGCPLKPWLQSSPANSFHRLPTENTTPIAGRACKNSTRHWPGG